MLIAYHAEPGSPTGERLQMLAHLAAPPPPTRTDTDTAAAAEAVQAPDQ